MSFHLKNAGIRQFEKASGSPSAERSGNIWVYGLCSIFMMIHLDRGGSDHLLKLPKPSVSRGAVQLPRRTEEASEEGKTNNLLRDSPTMTCATTATEAVSWGSDDRGSPSGRRQRQRVDEAIDN
ncbi:hypothetical protein P175DRAFT_0556059 [Aspergillus ochraceoroseus IBT 24754]|uniref:Uncharacterized protein n=1 Tax=Aspergillus ochraceoroseus IBT 24754 TaxID=1392256 RepID=A0A2T5M4G4_9EURO|nr:uncharacterized protein P175DRAFT_0556059 [Aspergillus ochraceoroseus IBT 24754]PTU23419.1 hypothetical protein P175DRAFT_0556059 [Aspergillus ochraceoroseus IBT 24754]